jgi:hypothetical protein
MKTLYLCLLMSFLICSIGFGQSNKMSSKKSSLSSNSVIKEEKVNNGSSNHKVKPTYQSGKMHNSTKGYTKVDDIVVEKNLANSARIKKANFASSKKYKMRQQDYLNDLNSHSQNTHMKGGKKRAYDGTFGF